MVPKMGLEPTHPKAYAPQTYVSTIPPPGQNRRKIQNVGFKIERHNFEFLIRNFELLVVHPVGFEPTTNGFEDRYSSNWAMGAFFPIRNACGL